MSMNRSSVRERRKKQRHSKKVDEDGGSPEICTPPLTQPRKGQSDVIYLDAPHKHGVMSPAPPPIPSPIPTHTRLSSSIHKSPHTAAPRNCIDILDDDEKILDDDKKEKTTSKATTISGSQNETQSLPRLTPPEPVLAQDPDATFLAMTPMDLLSKSQSAAAKCSAAVLTTPIGTADVPVVPKPMSSASLAECLPTVSLPTTPSAALASAIVAASARSAATVSAATVTHHVTGGSKRRRAEMKTSGVSEGSTPSGVATPLERMTLSSPIGTMALFQSYMTINSRLTRLIASPNLSPVVVSVLEGVLKGIDATLKHCEAISVT